MIWNASKCHLNVSEYKDYLMFAKVGDALLWEETLVILLGIIIDSSLTFNDYVKMMCKKPSQKLTGISRMSKYISDNKIRIVSSYLLFLTLSWGEWCNFAPFAAAFSILHIENIFREPQ